MQPYFFPYIGYFQLMKAVDLFIFHDDVQYIKSGWVNRNRILANSEPVWFTLPVESASHSAPIDQRNYQLNDENRVRLKRRLEASYAKAPMYAEVLPFLSELLDCADSNVALFNRNLLTVIAQRLEIRCKFLVSSEVSGLADIKAQDKVIELCKCVSSTSYINPIGGLDLYAAPAFADKGIDLHFLRSNPINYPQFATPHVAHLSIIDVLMFNPIEQLKRMLDEYTCVTPATRKLS